MIESSRLRQDEGALIVHPDGSLAYYYTSYASGSSDKDRARIARKMSRSKGVFWDAQEILFDPPEWRLLHPGVAHLADGRLGLRCDFNRWHRTSKVPGTAILLQCLALESFERP